MIVQLELKNLPKSKRIKTSYKYLTLSQPNVRVQLKWDMDLISLAFLNFLGYWVGKGYYEKFVVAIAAANDIGGLMPAIEYIVEEFKCNYKLKKNGTIRFDSAILKYLMLGLGFTNNKNENKSIPSWLIQGSIENITEFLRGYITACSTVTKDIKCKTHNIEIKNILIRLFDNLGIKYNDHNGLIIISEYKSKQIFSDRVGFLNEKKKMKLYRDIRTYQDLPCRPDGGRDGSGLMF